MSVSRNLYVGPYVQVFKKSDFNKLGDFCEVELDQRLMPMQHYSSGISKNYNFLLPNVKFLERECWFDVKESDGFIMDSFNVEEENDLFRGFFEKELNLLDKKYFPVQIKWGIVFEVY